MSIHVSYNQPSQEIHSYDGKLSAVVQGSGNLTVEIHVTAGSWDTATSLYYRQDDTEVEGLVNVSESNDHQYLLPCAYLATGTVRIALSNGGTTTNFMNINLTKVSSSEDPADDDPQFTLDNKKRLVLVPGSQNLLAIQFDNESEVVTFKFPRYQEGVDLSTKTPYVNYRRPQAGDLGKSLCTFDEIEDDTIYFSWLIDANVTNYEGTIKFQVEFSDSDGYRWQSQIGELPILTSIYNTGLEPYAPSFLETILNQMQGYARDSEAYAVGTRNGTPVTSGDPAYKHNALHFAEWFFMSKMPIGAKDKLLTLLEHVAYTDENGGQYLQDLRDEIYSTAEIVELMATFVQGSVHIYDTDSLDALKPMLTVTGLFDDTQVREITGYTLSGTLTIGTSTITVSYGSKTATFSVTVDGVVLPSGYTRYGYLKMIQSPTAAVASDRFIVLNTLANLDVLGVDFTFSQTDDSTSQYFYGVRVESDFLTSFALYSSVSNGVVRVYHVIHGKAMYASGGITPNKKNRLKVWNPATSPVSLQLNGGSIANASWDTANPNNNAIRLFTNPLPSATSQKLNPKALIGDLILLDANNNIVAYYVPCVYNNRIGVYDGISQQFYTTSGANYSTIGNSNCLYGVGNWS